MALAREKLVSEAMKTIGLRICSYQNQQLEGCLFHASIPAGEHFDNVMQFLIRVTQILDEMDFPQSAQRRVFHKGTASMELELQKPQEATAIATFYIRILFRQNGSWQGIVTWNEGGDEETFHSALELLLLIDDALSQKGE